MADKRGAALSAARRALLDRYLRGETGTRKTSMARHPPGDAPLSFAQERLWLLDRLGEDAYHIPSAFRLRGALDRAVLARALTEILRRHEVLRTSFPAPGERPVQRVEPAFEVEIEAVEASEGEALGAAESLSGQAFNLARGPPWRVGLWRLAAEDHLVCLCCHHIVFDGGSVGILAKELAALYGAFREGRPSPLAALPIQYADYARWQRGATAGLENDREYCDLEYWRARLRGMPEVTELPASRTREAETRDRRGAGYTATLSREIRDRVRDRARGLGVTPFILLLAAFKTLVYRYTGRRDLLLGTPVANRHPLETEGLIGCFVNTVVLRSAPAGGLRFVDYLATLKAGCIEALAHADLPFERVVEALAPERDLKRNPLFQILFSYQTDPLQALTLDGLSITPVALPRTTAKLDLSIEITDTGQGLEAVWEYDAGRYDGRAIARLSGHYRTLIEALLTAPETPLGEVPLMTANERAALAECNATAADYPREPVITLLERQVDRSPEATALVSGDQALGYRELDDRANRLAHWLRAQGVGPDHVIGVCLERSVGLVVALIAIHKAGGAYLPLEPEHPAERLAAMLADGGARLVITETRFRDRLPAAIAQIRLDQLPAPWDQAPGTRLNVAVLPEHLAYVIFTSGSSGRPKGVAVPHRGLANRLYWMQAYLGLGPHDAVLQKTPFGFDVSVWEFFWPLLVGARLVLAAPGEHRDPERLATLVAAHGVTTLHFVPSMLDAFLAAPGIPRLPSLRQVVCSGEALAPVTVARFFDRHDAALYNLYGPTETSIDVTAQALERGFAGHAVPIGRPIFNTAIHLLDRDLNPLPAGVPGEIGIGGVGLARGYLGRPGHTAAAFIPDPCGPPGARLYRSGDLAVRRAEGGMANETIIDGAIHYLGRIDQQVKLRGRRLEPGEVEARLCAHAGVREACVCLREERAGGSPRLVAYITCRDPAPGAAALRAHLLRSLPEYLVPATYVFLDTLPVSSNGKRDRAALPSPPPLEPSDDIAPDRPLEAALARIWAEVLGLERVGIQDNFFGLGGDSIEGLQVVARAREEGIRITARDLFEHQTPAALAQVAGLPAPDAEDEAASAPAPLTPIQRWFIELQPAHPHHFNQAVLLRVRPPLHAALVESAAQALLTHHGALRLRFLNDGGQWRQAPGPAAPVLVRVDLTAVAPEDEGRALAAAAHRWQASLDVTRGPLVRMVWFERAPGRGPRLLIIIHHLVVDAVSWRILLTDLETACRQQLRAEPIVLPGRTAGYSRWATRLGDHAGSGILEPERAYWQGLGRAAPLPVDEPAGGNRMADATRMTVALEEEDTAALTGTALAAYRTTPEEMLLTGLCTMLCRWLGQDSVRLDLEGHGREALFEDIDVSRTVGWFTSLYPVRFETGAAPGPGARLKSVKETLRAVPGKGLGYGLLRYGGNEIASPSSPVRFNYLGRLEGLMPKDALLEPIEGPTGEWADPALARPYEFDLSAHVRSGRLHLEWEYSRARYREDTVRGLAEAVLGELRALIAHCRSAGAGGYTPSDFPLAGLGQSDLDALIGARPDLEDIYPATPVQEGMLYEGQAQAGVYIQQLQAVIVGGLDSDDLRAAWGIVMDRHAVLRTGFLWAPSFDLHGGLLQVVYRHLEVPLVEEDWRELPGEAAERRWRETLAVDAGQGFDHARPPLMRLRLVRLADDRYRFLWTHHHALLDGWCVGLLLNELWRCYAGLRRKERVRLPVVRPYRDYVAWLSRQGLLGLRSLHGLSSPAAAGSPSPDAATGEAPAKGVNGALAATRDYWAAALAGKPVAAPFAMGPPGAGQGCGEEALDLPPEPSGRLTDFARRQGLTLNTLVQGAWALLLSRYGRTREVVFGVTVSGRPADLPGVEAIVGLFINTLPLLVAVPPHARTLDWLRGLMARNAALRRHEHTPLSSIRDLSGPFDSIVVFENQPRAAQPPVGEVRVESVEVVERTGYPLTLAILPGETLGLRIAYRRARFGAAAITRLLGDLAGMLAGFVEHPEAPLGDIAPPAAPPAAPPPPVEHPEAPPDDVMGFWGRPRGAAPTRGIGDGALGDGGGPAGAGHARIRGSGTMTTVDHPGTSVVERFERQRAARPGAPAVSGGPERWSYAELGRRADRIATALAARGVGREDLVAIATGPSPWAIAGLVGIMKTGAAYLPLEAAQPPARWAEVLREARPRRVLAAPEYRERLCEAEPLILDADLGVEHGEAAPWRALLPDQLAYVLYTSGSTGTPKGVAVRHAGLANRIGWGVRAFGWGDADVILQRTGLGFDVAAWEVFGALCAGARLVLCGEAAQKDPERLVSLMTDEAVTWIEVVPSLLEALLEIPGFGARLRGIGCGGETLRPSLLRRCRERLPGVRLYNCYGPTEASIDATVWDCGSEPIDDPVPIGRPIARTGVEVLDLDLHPVPPGVVGELYVAGAGLARGYLQRPASSAERFLPDPSGEPGARMYRTGDLGRRRADGALEFLGRSDHQVKLRGHRIELGEVEARLRGHAAVRDAGAVIEGSGAEARIVAYLVAERTIDEDSLHAHLRSTLPAYMLPARLVFLDALPRTAHGKLDRAALSGNAPAPPRTYVAPRDPAERFLARLWAEVLGIERVGVHDDFFALGGHSLLAMRMFARLRAVYERELPLSVLAEAPTVAALAARIASLETGAVERLVRSPRHGPPVLSFAQERLWFLHELYPESAAYHLPLALRIRGALDLEMLRAALGEVGRRHEVLRTRFPVIEGRAVPLIEPATPVELPVIDRSDRSEALCDLEAEAGRPFDLGVAPPWRARAWRLAGDEHLVLFVCHHIIFDGWSVEVLLRDIALVYTALRRGDASPLPAPALQYSDYAAWQRRCSGGLGPDLDYWRARLSGYPGTLALPTDRPRPSVQNHRGAGYTLSLGSGATRGIQDLARARAVTPFMLLLAAFKVLLARWSGQSDVCVATPVAGRTSVETEGLIGCFVNTLVLRSDLGGDPRFCDYLLALKRVCLDAQAHQGLPFEQLVEALSPARDPSRAPLVQVLFSLENSPLRAVEIEGLDITPIESPSTGAQLDLAVDVFEAAAGFDVRFEYDRDLFLPETIAGLARAYRRLLETVLVRPEERISVLWESIDFAGPRREAIVDGAGLCVGGGHAEGGHGGPPLPAIVDGAERGGVGGVAPRTRIETLLAEIWAEVLCVDRVGVDDDFFALGGHSLSAVRLTHRLRGMFGAGLSVLTLFEAPTVSRYAARIAERGRRQGDDGIVLLRTGGALPALYCLPTGTGHTLDYRPLAEALPEGRPVYGLPLPAFFDPEAPAETLDAVAEHFAGLIMDREGGRSHHLLGWSLGGLLALAVAARLEARGAGIAFLGLVDTGAPRPRGARLHWTDRFAPYLHDPAERARLHALPEDERQALDAALTDIPGAEQPAYLARFGQTRGYWFRDASPESLDTESALWRHVEVLEDSFTAPCLRAPLQVFWARASLDAAGRPPIDWSSTTEGKVTVQVLDGDHAGIIRNPDLALAVHAAADGRDTTPDRA